MTQKTDDTPRRTWPVRARFLGVAALMLFLGILLGRGFAPTKPAETPEEHAEHASSKTYTCSMHPQIQSPEPGTCPICGMDLIEASGGDTGATLKPSEVRLTPRARALARIQTTPVKTSARLGEPHQLLGNVVRDEGAIRAATTWISGRVDHLLVSTTGERVKRGQVLARLYSPDVYAAHQDLLAAREQVQRLEKADAFARSSAKAQVASARQRLRLLGLTNADLTRMERASKPWTSVPIRSAVSGTVLSREVRQGQYVRQGQTLYELADLGTVWLEFDAYESDLKSLTVGQRMSISVDALPGSTREGTVSFIDPVVDPKTLVATARVEVSNEDRALKPGMSVRATLGDALVPPGQPLPLVIPRSAPLFAGARALVYVETQSDTDGTTYRAREVTLGARVGDAYIVLAGLQRGERVVTHGAFTLDSDLQIRGGLSLMARADDVSRPDGVEPLTLTNKARQTLQPVLGGYLDLQELLAKDTLPAERATRWRDVLETIALEPGPLGDGWGLTRRALMPDVRALIKANSLESARLSFSRVTQVMDDFLARFGNVLDVPIRQAYCPMVRNDQGDHWYQRGAQVDNAYFGSKMLRCGEIQRVLGAGTHAMGGGDVE